MAFFRDGTQDDAIGIVHGSREADKIFRKEKKGIESSNISATVLPRQAEHQIWLWASCVKTACHRHKMDAFTWNIKWLPVLCRFIAPRTQSLRLFITPGAPHFITQITSHFRNYTIPHVTRSRKHNYSHQNLSESSVVYFASCYVYHLPRLPKHR
jgi:hypothetical protein